MEDILKETQRRESEMNLEQARKEGKVLENENGKRFYHKHVSPEAKARKRQARKRQKAARRRSK